MVVAAVAVVAVVVALEVTVVVVVVAVWRGVGWARKRVSGSAMIVAWRWRVELGGERLGGQEGWWAGGRRRERRGEVCPVGEWGWVGG